MKMSRREKQVCTREQSAKLNELGVVQESVFYWHPDWNNPMLDEHLIGSKYIKLCEGSLSAFTVAELGAAWAIAAAKDEYDLSDELKGKYPEYQLIDWMYSPLFVADMLIYSLEKGFVTASEVNERLKAA